MAKRSGQAGQVFLRNDRWVGRFYVDVAEKRVRRALVLGMKKELTRPEARRKLLEVITSLGVNAPAHLERATKPPTTFNAVADSWKEKRLPRLKESSQYSVPKLITKHLRPFFGQLAIEEIKTGTVNDWIAWLGGEGLAPKSIHDFWKLFRAIMNWHAQQGDAAPRKWYPALPTIPEVEQRWFTQEEVGQIVSAAKGQHRVLFHLAGASGLRAGELFGLHIEDLDLGRGVIRVRRSVWRGRELAPKTKRGYRDVWIDSATARLLGEHLAGRTTGRLFQTRNGTPLTLGAVIKHVLHPLCDQLGISRGGMHAFRHGRVSHLQASGVPADFTKSQVGHSSLRTTSSYTHFSDGFRKELVERVGPSWTHSVDLDSAKVRAKRV